MIPRFIRTFLTISLLILLPTLYFLYQPSSSSSFDSLSDQDDFDLERSIANQKGHWDKGGSMPLGKGWEDEKGRAWDDDDDETSGRQDALDGGGGKIESGSKVGAKQMDQLNMGVNGGVIMGKLKNETAKAELGRAAWKVMHTMTLRFPEHPTADERQALSSYFHLFSRLYPCGECAEEFQALLRDYPPQTSSKKSASLWLCSIHNMVNLRLGKPEFDCNMLEGTYDCGCGDEGGADAAGQTDVTRGPTEGNPDGEEESVEGRDGGQGRVSPAGQAGIKQYDLKDVDEVQDEAEGEASHSEHAKFDAPSGRKGSAKWRIVDAGADAEAEIESDQELPAEGESLQQGFEPLALPLPGKIAGKVADEEGTYASDWGREKEELTVEEIVDLVGGYGGDIV